VTPAQTAAALASGVVQLGGRRLTFTHPLLRTAAYDLLPPDDRMATHALLASVTDDAIERGHHVYEAAAGPSEAVARQLDEAALAAAALGDHAGAAAFARRAADLSPTPGETDWARRLLRSADELVVAGDVPAALDICRSLMERMPPGRDRAEAQLYLIRHPETSRALDEDMAGLDQVSREAAGDDALLAETYRTMAECSYAMCKLEDARRWIAMSTSHARRAGLRVTAAHTLAITAMIDSHRGRGVTPDARRAVADWDQVSVLPDAFTPVLSLGVVLMIAGMFGEAEALFDGQRTMAEERGLEPIEVMARALLAEVQARAGRWSEALENGELAVEHARQASNSRAVLGASYGLAMASAMVGRHQVAREVSLVVLAEAEETEDFWFIIDHRAVLGQVAHAEGDADEAVRALAPAWRLMRDRDLGDLSCAQVASALGEALALSGRPGDAVDLARTLRACPVGGLPWCQTVAARVEALAATVSGDHDAARRFMAMALEACERLPEPFEQARTHHVAGWVERGARNWGAARTALVEALDRYDQLGAARWSERAAADIARLPGRRPSHGLGLPTREHEIAVLVADGLSNGEVAARLFVSRRTVEANLSKVYGKLGVRGRTELTRVMSRETSTG